MLHTNLFEQTHVFYVHITFNHYLNIQGGAGKGKYPYFQYDLVNIGKVFEQWGYALIMQ